MRLHLGYEATDAVLGQLRPGPIDAAELPAVMEMPFRTEYLVDETAVEQTFREIPAGCHRLDPVAPGPCLDMPDHRRHGLATPADQGGDVVVRDRQSTRLTSSH